VTSLEQPPNRQSHHAHGARPLVDESLNPWKTITSKQTYENPWISVREDQVIDPSGKPGIYGVMSPKNFALGVLPIFEDGTTVLVGQYRYALDRYSWEMPEGGGKIGTDPAAAIARELAEETGYRAAGWKLLHEMSLSNSVTDEWVMTWLAWDLVEGEAEPESTEDLSVWRLPFSELVELVLDGKVFDSMTVAAVTLVETRRHRGVHSGLPESVMNALRG
jgi:8-oxo-dGTP pyrophosphatase MutT (NUDIX family)